MKLSIPKEYILLSGIPLSFVFEDTLESWGFSPLFVSSSILVAESLFAVYKRSGLRKKLNQLFRRKRVFLPSKKDELKRKRMGKTALLSLIGGLIWFFAKESIPISHDSHMLIQVAFVVVGAVNGLMHLLNNMPIYELGMEENKVSLFKEGNLEVTLNDLSSFEINHNQVVLNGESERIALLELQLPSVKVELLKLEFGQVQEAVLSRKQLQEKVKFYLENRGKS